jgi:uncharacterized membrane protein YhaH (DUF805 family)
MSPKLTRDGRPDPLWWEVLVTNEEYPPASPPPPHEQPSLNPVRLLPLCFKWSGRFTAREFTAVFLTALVAALALAAITFGVAIAGGSEEMAEWAFRLTFQSVLVLVVFGASVRRLRDMGRSGWWMFMYLVPLLKWAVPFFLIFTPGSAPPYEKGSAVQRLAHILLFALLLLGMPLMLWNSQYRIHRNESVAIEGLQRRVAGQLAYARANGGFFDSRWHCLSAPAQCIAGYSGSAFMSPEYAAVQRSGYEWLLIPARALPADQVPEGLSPTSTDGFVVAATPILPGYSGVAAFCGDSFGTLCYYPSGEGPLEHLDGAPWIRCGATCTPLQ